MAGKVRLPVLVYPSDLPTRHAAGCQIRVQSSVMYYNTSLWAIVPLSVIRHNFYLNIGSHGELSNTDTRPSGLGVRHHLHVHLRGQL